MLDEIAKLLSKDPNYDKEWNEITSEIEIETVYDEDDNIIKSETKRKVKLNKPFRTPSGPKKFSVYVKNDKGNIVKVNFGDPDMEIKRDDPERRKSFRARHNCDNPGPKYKARYWSCKMWESNKSVTDYTSGQDEENYMTREQIISEAEKKRPGLWDNIRKKKEKMGKRYRPAKPGSPDRPDKKQWDKLTSEDYPENETVEQEFEEYKEDFLGMIIGSLESIRAHTEQILMNLEDPEVKENLTEPFLQQAAILAEDYILTIHNYVMFNKESE
jgi:hypothetical protein